MHLKKYLRYIAVAAVAMLPLIAAQFGGQVKFVGPPKAPATAGEAPGPPVVLPLPGATVTATQGDKTVTAVADEQGNFLFPDLPDGTWQLQADMVGFSSARQEVATGTGLPGPVFQLKMLPLDQIEAAAAPAAPASTPAPSTTSTTAPGAATPAPSAATPAPTTAAKGKTPAAPAATAFQRTNLNGSGAAPADAAPPPAAEVTSELNQRAADGFLINGSSQNGASTPFAQNPAFGNNRKGGPRFYTYSILLNESNSALNAAPFSLTGQQSTKQPYNQLTGGFQFGGPIQIPHLISRTKMVQFQLSYQRVENRQSSIADGLMPTAAERAGNFSSALYPNGQPVEIFDPANGLPFANNMIPVSRFSQQALSLLQYYPQPNFTGSSVFNYQEPLISNTHSDALRTTVSKSFKRKNFIQGLYAMQDSRGDSNSLFNFLDLSRSLGQNATLTYRRTFTPRFYGTFTYQFTRQSIQTIPFFENGTNVEGNAGITGVNDSPLYWGPPSLAFSQTQIRGLGDQNPSIVHNQTNAYGYLGTWNHGRHNIQFGGDYKWQQFNTIGQGNPRGSFTFNGQATQQTTVVNGVSTLVPNTGSDFADYLLGVPDQSQIAYGNADKYLRAKVADLFFTDDWKVSPGLSITLGFRWEYTSPIIEKYGRLVNLDIAPGYTAVAPVCATNLDGCATVGPLTGEAYPASLVRPDKHEFRPLPGLAWRPFPASSMVVRAGYGIAYNTQVYNYFANQMDQQSPLSRNLTLLNTTTPLTLANGFPTPPNLTTNNIALDPNFKIGYAQVWNASIQRDLPGSLVMLATYTGSKGTHLLQEFVPNTYPIGAVNPCPTCPSNFVYFTSGANSTREAGQMNLRRRLHNGFTAQVIYTYSKSIDDAAAVGSSTGGQPAQNWRNLEGERGLSNFDQRHVGQIQLQYTSGMGMGGGTLLSGWRGKLVKDWTFLDNINLATGLPMTPIYPENLSPVLNSVRASYTGADIYDAPAGHTLNPLAVTAPAPGQFGNAGIGSITGPSQFSMNASAQRSFRLNDRFTLSLQINANNPLNHVIATAWGNQVISSQFGEVTAVNAMRSVTTVMRLTF